MRGRADDDPKVEPMLHHQNTRASRRVAAVASAHSAMRRPLIGIAVGAALIASAATGLVYAPAALAAVPSEAALAKASDVVQDSKIVLTHAQALNHVVLASSLRLDATSTEVDLADLTDDVRALAAPNDMSADRLAELTDDVVEGAATVKGKTAALQDALTSAKEAAAAHLAAEAERVAAEKAAEKARRAAAALAAANTVDGAKATARRMGAERYGWGDGQFSCLSSLWAKESGWNYQAYNDNGGATGIPQALPGSKMATAGSDWRTNASTQISWGLDYINRAYGSPCAAWGHSQAVNWY